MITYRECKENLCVSCFSIFFSLEYLNCQYFCIQSAAYAIFLALEIKRFRFREILTSPGLTENVAINILTNQLCSWWEVFDNPKHFNCYEPKLVMSNRDRVVFSRSSINNDCFPLQIIRTHLSWSRFIWYFGMGSYSTVHIARTQECTEN